MLSPASLERIKQLRGTEELKSLADRLLNVAVNKQALPTSRIQLPNYLFIEAPGCGVTTHIQMITDLLAELRLIPFEGDRRCFEWVLDGDAFRSGGAFERLLDEIVVMAGFHSTFKGVLGLEIDAWQDKSDAEAFTRLMDLADDCLGDILIIFIVQMKDGYEPSALIRRLSAEMPLEVIHCPLPSTDDMALYLGDFLNRRNFQISETALRRLKELLPELTSIEAFDGFQTLDNLADEIVYRFCASRDRRGNYVIEEEDLAFIQAPDGYIDRLTARNRKAGHRAIGFRTGDEWH